MSERKKKQKKRGGGLFDFGSKDWKPAGRFIIKIEEVD
jgi:hypothetical protein